MLLRSALRTALVAIKLRIEGCCRHLVEFEFMRKYRLIVYAMAVVVLYFCIYWIFAKAGVENSSSGKGSSTAAEFGDSFGYINAWFSGLAFAGVVLALLIQTAEFHLAERERAEGIEAQQEIARQGYYSSVASLTESLNTIRARQQVVIEETQWTDEAFGEMSRHLRIAVNDYFSRVRIELLLEKIDFVSGSFQEIRDAEAELKIEAHNALEAKKRLSTAVEKIRQLKSHTAFAMILLPPENDATDPMKDAGVRRIHDIQKSIRWFEDNRLMFVLPLSATWELQKFYQKEIAVEPADAPLDLNREKLIALKDELPRLPHEVLMQVAEEAGLDLRFANKVS